LGGVAVAASAPCLLVLRGPAGGDGIAVSASNPDQPGLQLAVTLDELQGEVAPGAGCKSAGRPRSAALSFGALPSGEHMGESVAVACSWAGRMGAGRRKEWRNLVSSHMTMSGQLLECGVWHLASGGRCRGQWRQARTWPDSSEREKMY
jgi:hypothetical protein